MLNQRTLWKLEPIKKDVVYTPGEVALDIIRWVHPTGKILDPCAGDLAFLQHLPGADWCEIRRGRDFFDYQTQVDWIIGNPPYSIFEAWLAHSFELANDVVYILPINKVFQRLAIMNMIAEFGGIRGLRVYGSGSRVGFPFGFSVGAFWFKRGYTSREIQFRLTPVVGDAASPPAGGEQTRTDGFAGEGSSPHPPRA